MQHALSPLVEAAAPSGYCARRTGRAPSPAPLPPPAAAPGSIDLAAAAPPCWVATRSPAPLPAEGPMPPVYVALVEVGGERFAAGPFGSAEAARAGGEALAAGHRSLALRGVAELVTVELAAQLAAVHDAVETADAADRLGGAGEVA
jgi:hypothetical protein